LAALWGGLPWIFKSLPCGACNGHNHHRWLM
jgi:hypothetical protein